jgi:hypothetical protein
MNIFYEKRKSLGVSLQKEGLQKEMDVWLWLREWFQREPVSQYSCVKRILKD